MHSGAFALAVGLAISAFLIKSRWNFLTIPKLSPGPFPGSTPDCMVVIPARNEEMIVARVVASLPPDTVIVVDDHSEDRTAEAARKAGAGVVRAPELPRGAAGKAHACMTGARLLTSKWVLFADADTTFDPGFLDAAVACAEASDLSLLSFYLVPRFETWSERLLGPLGIALYFCGIGPRSDPTAIFNGQCLLVRRKAYEFLGGHAAVLHTAVEDVKLAMLARRHRLRFGVARTGLGRVHLRGIRGTIVRSAPRFLLASPWNGGAIVAAAAAMSLWGPALVWLIADGQWISAAVFALLPSALLWVWYRGPSALLAPAAIYAILPALFRGLLGAFTGRPVEWKGRSIGAV